MSAAPLADESALVAVPRSGDLARAARRATRRLCDGPTLLRAFRSAVANLEAHVEEVNAFNVFPVPDGDTGTNMLATVRAALTEAEGIPPAQRTLERVAEALAFGALMGARGNSGLILSQVLRGMAEAARGRHHADGVDLGLALRRGTESAYAAVVKPVEGTILTVVREAADAAAQAGARDRHVETVLVHAVGEAERSVARTPSLLPVLAEAGVIDSGGHGLYLLLRGLLIDFVDAKRTDGAGSTPLLAYRMPVATEAALEFGYETMFVLMAEDVPLDLAQMRVELEAIGESIGLAGDAHAATVHVHSPRPDAVLAWGFSRGRPRRITVEDLDDQARARAERIPAGDGAAASESARTAALMASALRDGHVADDGYAAFHHIAPASGGTAPSPTDRFAATPRVVPVPAVGGDGGPGTSEAGPPAAPLIPRPAVALAVVAVCSGEGLARVLRSLGVAEIVNGGQSANPSTGELMSAIRVVNAREVIVLPNNPNVRLTAEQAARLCSDVRVAVVETRNVAEGIAAVLALKPGCSAADNVAPMLAAARGLQTLQVTEAVRDAKIAGRAVRRGQTIALDPDDGLLAAGDDRIEATMEALGRLRPGFELVTVYVGDDLGRAGGRSARAPDPRDLPGGRGGPHQRRPTLPRVPDRGRVGVTDRGGTAVKDGGRAAAADRDVAEQPRPVVAELRRPIPAEQS